MREEGWEGQEMASAEKVEQDTAGKLRHLRFGRVGIWYGRVKYSREGGSQFIDNL